jgi:hypothetical protein
MSTQKRRVRRHDLGAELSKERQAHAGIEQQIAAAEAKRRLLLLEGDQAGLDATDAELAGLRAALVRSVDRIAVLTDEQTADDRRRRERQDQDRKNKALEKNEARVAAAKRAALACADLVKHCRDARGLGAEILAMLPLDFPTVNAAMLGSALEQHLSFELFRLGGEGFVGATCPTPSTNRTPEMVRPFATAIDEAADYFRRAIDRLGLPAVAAVSMPPATAERQEATARVATVAPVELTPPKDEPRIPAGEHVFTVTLTHSLTGEDRVEEILFGPEEMERAASDTLGVMGPAGRLIAVEKAKGRAGDEYTFKAVTFDLARLVATAERASHD